MTALLPALSLSNKLLEVGALAAFAALVGIAILSLLVFSQARELKRLREWAGRAPERAAELEQRAAAEAAMRAQRPRTAGRVPRATPMIARQVAGQPPATALTAAGQPAGGPRPTARRLGSPPATPAPTVAPLPAPVPGQPALCQPPRPWRGSGASASGEEPKPEEAPNEPEVQPTKPAQGAKPEERQPELPTQAAEGEAASRRPRRARAGRPRDRAVARAGCTGAAAARSGAGRRGGRARLGDGGCRRGLHRGRVAGRGSPPPAAPRARPCRRLPRGWSPAHPARPGGGELQTAAAASPRSGGSARATAARAAQPGSVRALGRDGGAPPSFWSKRSPRRAKPWR